MGRDDELPHTLLPLSLAADLVRAKFYAGRHMTGQDREADLNTLATFIAGMIPIYEYAQDLSEAPRALAKAEIDGGLFRNGGKSLVFIDGRPARPLLAVNVDDVQRVTEMLSGSRINMVRP